MFLEKSNCHPNPCENEGTCIDKYYYLDDIKSDNSFYIKDSSHENVVSKSSDIEGDFMAEHGFGEQSHIKQINDMSVEQRLKNKYLFKRSINGTLDDDTNLLNVNTSKIKFVSSVDNSTHHKDTVKKHLKHTLDLENRSLDMLLSSHFTQKYTRSDNEGELPYLKILNIKRAKRNEYDLPSGVNKNDLNFYGFACICPIRFKGHKCESMNLFFCFNFFLTIIVCFLLFLFHIVKNKQFYSTNV